MALVNAGVVVLDCAEPEKLAAFYKELLEAEEVAANANRVESYAPAVCSSKWSCRVGNYVIINQDRWKYASPAWNDAGGTLREYRHMVVNHESGHWLGWRHRDCTGAGDKAPVMQQQSIRLSGCTFNPWPLKSELKVPRFN